MSINKYIILLACFLLPSCGEAPTPTGFNVVSKGTLQDQTSLYQWTFRDVKACVQQNYSGRIREGEPTEILVTDAPINYGGQTELRGFVEHSSGYIYLMDSSTLFNPLIDDTFPHEILHWLTYQDYQGSNPHTEAWFTKCSNPLMRGMWSGEPLPAANN